MQGIRSLIQGLIAAHKMPQRIEAADKLEKAVEAYANDRVIDELARWIEKGDDDGGGVFTHELYQRVNELSLKQK